MTLETYEERTKPAVLDMCLLTFDSPTPPASVFFKGIVQTASALIVRVGESSRAEYRTDRENAARQLGIYSDAAEQFRRKFRRAGK